ncbi:MAG TPA: hypothetical protein VI007_13225, partial [bacterium]
ESSNIEVGSDPKCRCVEFRMGKWRESMKGSGEKRIVFATLQELERSGTVSIGIGLKNGALNNSLRCRRQSV